MRKGWESWISSAWRRETEGQTMLLSTASWLENDRARVFLRAHSNRTGGNGSRLQGGRLQIEIRGGKPNEDDQILMQDVQKCCVVSIFGHVQNWLGMDLNNLISLGLFWAGHKDNLNSGNPSQPKSWFWNSGSILEIMRENFYLLIYRLPQRYEHFKHFKRGSLSFKVP